MEAAAPNATGNAGPGDPPGGAPDGADPDAERMRRRDLEGRGIRDPAVLAALRAVPRRRFVPAALADRAYDDGPLPIGDGQTISQPYIVALMTELAAPGPGDTALEIGTGSGYQTAVLARLARRVFSLEVRPALAAAARARLDALGVANATVRAGDGFAGWPEEAPFDVILVTAAPETVPSALVDQLKPGGRLVLPVGPADAQVLRRIDRDAAGRVHSRDVIPVRFVPMVPG